MKVQKKRATLHDVARAVGVSYQTVSRVINNSPNVSNITRRRVLRAITELDYSPNRAARILSTRRSHTLQVITLDVWISSSEMLYGIIAAAEARGYQVVLTALRPQDLGRALKGADRQWVDGFIVVNPLLRVDDVMLTEFDLPLVQIGGRVTTGVSAVMVDQVLGGRLAAQHLIDLGHTRFAELTGAVHLWDAVGRHEGWSAALAGNGYDPQYSVPGNFTARGGYEGVNTLLKQYRAGTQPPFTALFAANDSSALGAILALRERGLRVPEDVSVIGFDDTLDSAYFAPPLTTLRQDMALLGRLAVEHLLSFIDTPDTPPYQRVTQPLLVVRQSTQKQSTQKVSFE